MKMTFKEVVRVIQKRYKLDIVTTNQVAKPFFDENEFENEKELVEFLDSLEVLGKEV